MKPCSKNRKLLAWLALGNLDDKQATALREHVATCEGCRSYLDELDAAQEPVPIDQRILASLGPLSLKMAQQRSCGTHPYFVPVEHTRMAREAEGTTA